MLSPLHKLHSDECLRYSSEHEPRADLEDRSSDCGAGPAGGRKRKSLGGLLLPTRLPCPLVIQVRLPAFSASSKLMSSPLGEPAAVVHQGHDVNPLSSVAAFGSVERSWITLSWSSQRARWF